MTNTPPMNQHSSVPLLVVDAQIHLWESGDPGGTHRREPYDVLTALRDMEAAGVDASLVVPPPWDPHGNEVALRAARSYPTRFAVMGHLAAHEGANVALFEELSAEPGMVGLRVAFSQPSTRPGLLDARRTGYGRWRPEANVPLASSRRDCCYRVTSLVRHPDLKIIIDHIGLVTDTKDANAFESVIAQLPELAALPNVCDQAFVCACIFECSVPIREHFQLPASNRRDVRCPALLLGNRYHEAVVHLGSSSHAFHRAPQLAVGG